jgi:hypothetical protein
MRRSFAVRSAALLAAVGTVVAVGTGCSGQGRAESDAAAQAALDFGAAVEADPAEACSLLAPATREELESSEGPCVTAIADAGLPGGHGPAESVDVYGKDALVKTGSDALFLALFDDGWRVTAAGCTPVADGPYDCTLEAG